MADFEHARSLLRLARRDLDTIVAVQYLPAVADEIVGFHAQQAVEKALKSWISAVGLVYPLTHQFTASADTLGGLRCRCPAVPVPHPADALCGAGPL